MRNPLSDLGRRERQIMDILHRRGHATAAEVRADLPDPPSYSAVRAMLKLLEKKGYVEHAWDGPRHVHRPTADLDQVRRTAARHLLTTFFSDSMESAIAAMLGSRETPLSDEELERINTVIEQARRRGKKK
jgi:predicted transcriptional regulator